jgi:DNA-binding response OmpR family regulator
MTERAVILIVEDSAPTRAFLADNLTADGYEVLLAGDLAAALRTLELHPVDLAVVDIGLPDGSGLDLLRRVREAGGPGSRIDARLPLLVVSGRSGETDRVRGFERGADDFVTKPFSYGELRLRIVALLRRARERRVDGRLRVGELSLDPVAREVRVRGTRVALSAKEFALLRRLAAEPTRVYTKAELLKDVWGFRALGATRTLDSHACRLRRKLAVAGDHFIINVWGVGYRLIDGEVGEDAAGATAAAMGEPA